MWIDEEGILFFFKKKEKWIQQRWHSEWLAKKRRVDGARVSCYVVCVPESATAFSVLKKSTTFPQRLQLQHHQRTSAFSKKRVFQRFCSMSLNGSSIWKHLLTLYIILPDCLFCSWDWCPFISSHPSPLLRAPLLLSSFLIHKIRFSYMVTGFMNEKRGTFCRWILGWSILNKFWSFSNTLTGYCTSVHVRFFQKYILFLEFRRTEKYISYFWSAAWKV